MIRMLPFLLMTLHFSQIGFTDDLTFIVNLLSSFPFFTGCVELSAGYSVGYQKNRAQKFVI